MHLSVAKLSDNICFMLHKRCIMMLNVRVTVVKTNAGPTAFDLSSSLYTFLKKLLSKTINK